MRSAIGKSLRGIGKVGFYIVGLLGFIISLSIVQEAAGFWGFVAAFVLAPVTFAAAPWYALVAWGNPFPLVLNYVGILFCFLLQYLGDKIAGPQY